jgi:hypothetical protein
MDWRGGLVIESMFSSMKPPVPPNKKKKKGKKKSQTILKELSQTK